MAFDIIWSNEAEHSFNGVIDYLLYHWCYSFVHRVLTNTGVPSLEYLVSDVSELIHFDFPKTYTMLFSVYTVVNDFCGIIVKFEIHSEAKKSHLIEVVIK